MAGTVQELSSSYITSWGDKKEEFETVVQSANCDQRTVNSFAASLLGAEEVICKQVGYTLYILV